jgi:FAD/FMN-containing dehydrogenase
MYYSTNTFKKTPFMNQEVIQKLSMSGLHGKLITQDHADYNEVRKVHNGMIDKYPSVIARCANIEDVQTCVNFARDNDVLLAVRGGGHNAGGLGLCDGGLVIDLSLMKGIEINEAAKTVRAHGGCLLKELDAATHEIGMAVPGGIIGTTGVAGLTLGGGLGHLTRHYGLTIDNLLEAEVVLADGSLVKASTSENADLFWAIRGGGGNFGVVVSFLFKLNVVDTIYGGPMLWELEDTKEMMEWFDQYIAGAPNELNGFFVFLTVPPFAPFPENLHLKKMCGVVWCYSGEQSKAEEVFKPIRSYKTPALDFVGSLPLPALQTMFDGLYPAGLQWYWKAHFVKELSGNAIAVHIKFANELPTPLSSMHMYPVNGAAAGIGKNETAWNHRDANYAVVIVGVDGDAANKAKISDWAKDYWAALKPYSKGGAYVNFMMDEGEESVKTSYSDNYQRLVEIKTKFDPENLFKVNQNIKPSKNIISTE